MNFKVFKVASGGRGRHTNFEHVELGRVSTNFKVFKVASAGRAGTPTFKTLKLVGAQPVAKCSKLKPGPGIRHDTPCRASPAPEPFKLSSGQNRAGCGKESFRQPTPSRPSRTLCGFVPPTTAGATWPSRENVLNFENVENAIKPRRGTASTLNFGLGSRGRG